MSTILLITIAATAIISYFGFQNYTIFEKYKFNVSSILYRKEYVRLISSGFLHGDWMHLIFNMYALYIFGALVLNVYGVIGFLLIYLGSILLGNLFSLYIYKKQGWYSAIGASGGVSGIIFSSVAIDPINIKIGIIFLPPELSLPGFLFGLIYFGYSVYSMLNPRQNDMIGHAAHLGGAFFGLAYSVMFAPLAAASNALYLFIMSLPLLYLGYEIFIKKRIG